jgi:hypothetical protein
MRSYATRTFAARCAGLGLVLLVLLGAVPAGAQGFFKDEMLNLKVVTKLQFNKALLREKIDVKTANGIVTLSGNVSSEDAIRLAGKLAADTEGVVKVNNFLKVGAPISSNPGSTPT